MMDDRLSRIKMLAMDVDGTLTRGEMILLDSRQVKVFSVHDGLGIRLAMNAGLLIAWVTGNTSESVTERAQSLGVTDVHQGARFKSVALRELAASHMLELDEVAFIGDDLNDLPAFDLAGFSFAVDNATTEVKSRADYVTRQPGGSGAVREAIEVIFKARGEWDAAVESFLAELEREEAGAQGPEAVA